MKGPRVARNTLRVLLPAALPAVLALWAFAPLAAPPLPEPFAAPALEERGVAQAALDLAAFHAPLWVTPPAPPPPEPPPPPLPPLRFQLLAVLHEHGVHTAVLYDPDSDRILIVAEGEELAQGRTVERVTAANVRIRDASGTRTLALEPAGGPR